MAPKFVSRGMVTFSGAVRGQPIDLLENQKILISGFFGLIGFPRKPKKLNARWWVANPPIPP